MKFLVAIAMLFLFPVWSLPAQTGDDEDSEAKKKYIYEWTDNKGHIYITDDFGNIPEQYREKARRTEDRKTDQSQPGEIREQQPLSRGFDQTAEDTGRLEWLGRINDWKNRLRNAEARYADLERQRNELLARWGSPALAPAQDRIEAERMEQQMRDAQNEIEEAKNMIETVIPDDARKAGVPPGWLRE